MKKIIVLLMFAVTSASAQDWVRMMNDPSANFYDVQKSFNDYYKTELRKERNVFRKFFRWKKEEEQETPGYELYKRWEYFNQPRVYPTGNRLPSDLVWKEYYRMKDGSGQPEVQTSGNWTPMGPSSWITNSYNPGIGRVNVVEMDPNDSMKIYIGSPSGGIWRSTDGGATWDQPTTDKLPSIGVSAIAIDYTNSDVIYIGTGDADASDTYSNGVLKSIDGGVTWNATGLTYNLNQARKVFKLLIDPVDHNILYAGTNNGIMKTTDGGVTWTTINNGGYRDLEFQPGNSSVIYAAGTDFARSSNAGASWSVIQNGTPPTSDVNRLIIGVTPADPDYVYLAAGDAATSGFYGMYRSTDGGNSFTLQSNSPNIYGYPMDGSGGGGQSWYDMTLAVSPYNRDEIFTGGVNIWHSSDGGMNWDIRTHWYYTGAIVPYVHADQHWMDFEGDNLFVGCDGGVFKSSDLGNTWDDLSAGLTISQFYRLGGSELDPDMVMAGAQDNGCNLLKNGQWIHVLGADGMEVAISPANTNLIFAESQNGGINRSTNGGLTMANITGSINENGDWVTPYVIDPNAPQTLFAGFNNLWKSTNSGASWTNISNFLAGGNISAIAVAPSNSQYIYIVKGSTLMASVNGGFAWANISSGLPTASASMTYIAVDPADELRVWVTFSGTSSGNKVFHSPDGGATWINESLNLPNVPVNCIAYESGSADGIYIGTDLSVFYKNDSLTGWVQYNNDLPNVSVSELEINYNASKIRAATFGRGVWQSDLFVLSPPQADFKADKLQLCPGDNVQFTDMSVMAYAGWQWSFPGGNPSSSTLQNPVVNYANPGIYNAQLIVQNAAGSDTLTRILYINVSNPPTAAVPLSEGFEGASFPPAGWTITNADNQLTWTDALVGGFGTSSHSASVQNFGQSFIGQKDWLLSPVVDLTQLALPYLKFDRAYARIPNRQDSLRIFLTSDCGLTRNYIYGKTGSVLATAGVLTTAFTPAANQWISDSVALPVSAGQVQIGFENRNGYGNNLYIDNINIYNVVVGIDEVRSALAFSVYPNPASDEVIIRMDQSQTLNVRITDAAGKVVYDEQWNNTKETKLNVLTWPNGVYLIEGYSSDGKMKYNGKISVQH